MHLTTLIFIGGVLHFGILLASAAVPQALDWKKSLQRLDPLLRQLIWVHGVFIVLVIIGFGLLSLMFSHQLASGASLARGVCLFIALFWGARLAVQLFLFNAKPHLTSVWLKIGYHALTPVFAFHTVVYTLAAFVSHI
jgi:hypothetical protein